MQYIAHIPKTTSKAPHVHFKRRSFDFMNRSSRLLHSAAVIGSPVRSRPRSQCRGPSGWSGWRESRSW